jgi:hypothetical protein
LNANQHTEGFEHRTFKHNIVGISHVFNVVFRQQFGNRLFPANALFFIQVSKYRPDHRRVFNAGNYLDETGKFATNICSLEGLYLADSCYTPRSESRGRCLPVSSCSLGVNIGDMNNWNRPRELQFHIVKPTRLKKKIMDFTSKIISILVILFLKSNTQMPYAIEKKLVCNSETCFHKLK